MIARGATEGHLRKAKALGWLHGCEVMRTVEMTPEDDRAILNDPDEVEWLLPESYTVDPDEVYDVVVTGDHPYSPEDDYGVRLALGEEWDRASFVACKMIATMRARRRISDEMAKAIDDLTNQYRAWRDDG